MVLRMIEHLRLEAHDHSRSHTAVNWSCQLLFQRIPLHGDLHCMYMSNLQHSPLVYRSTRIAQKQPAYFFF